MTGTGSRQKKVTGFTDGNENNYHIIDPTVHAWMPLPRHFAAPEKGFSYNEDLMEHAMFEDDPEWLYKDDAVYTQMTLEEFMEGKAWTTTEQRKPKTDNRGIYRGNLQGDL